MELHVPLPLDQLRLDVEGPECRARSRHCEMSLDSNGLPLNSRIMSSYGDVVEFERGYLLGERETFADVELELEWCTEFQRAALEAIRGIPYGETATYGGMAMALGSGPRAVGMACGRNPIPIIVPCHRVLASGGKEGGFSGGKGLRGEVHELDDDAPPTGRAEGIRWSSRSTTKRTCSAGCPHR